MAFKPILRSVASIESPEALFRDLRNRKVAGLLSHQADMLRNYLQATMKGKEVASLPDVALQMPTGSGKTLVGLLIGEWRRRRFGQKVVYLCPTVQLVNQVVLQGQDYGIRAVALTGKQSKYPPASKAEYLSGDAVAVTTYSALFNTNSFYDTADTLVLDDAHAAENYVAEYWSLLIERRGKNAQPVLFDALVGLLKDVVSAENYERLRAPAANPWDMGWVDKVPVPLITSSVAHSLVGLLDQHVQGTDLQWPWRVLHDHLSACHIFISTDAILIRPLIPPTFSHAPFTQPSQRVYMSATLGAGGELERIWGRSPITRLTVPEGWDKQGIGRRLFLFPQRSLDPESTLALVLDMIKTVPRALLLVPDSRSETRFGEDIKSATGYKLFSASELEASKRPFVSATGAAAVIANRYDGIDLVGDECRLLVISSLPRAMNLQERFLVTRLAAGVLLRDRVLTRITQAVGRCTRSPTDYAAVVILGEELNKFLMQKDNRALLHPELQAELDFGIQQSSNVAAQDFHDYLRIFLEHKEEWDSADQEIINLREEMTRMTVPGTDKLQQSVQHEIRYQKALWSSDFDRAITAAREVLTQLSGPEVSGYRSFWNYLAGSAAWLAAQRGVSSMEGVARGHYRNAAATAAGVRWLMALSHLSSDDTVVAPEDLLLATLIDGLEAQLDIVGTVNSRKFEAEVKAILTGIASDDADAFELAQERLGRLLGFSAGKQSGDGTPDPWWCLGDELCIVFEDHTNVKDPDGNASLGANKVRQAASHPNWIRKNLSLASKVDIVSVMVTPRRSLMAGAAPHVSDVCYWHMDDFRRWTQEAVAVVRQVWATFPGAGDLEWRGLAMRAYRDAQLDPSTMVKTIRKNRLSDLPVAT